MTDLPYGGSGLPYGGEKDPYTPRKKRKADGGMVDDDDTMNQIISLAAQIISIAGGQQKPADAAVPPIEGSYASGGEVSAPIIGPHTITADDLIGRAVSTAQNIGAYTDAGGQKIAAPYVTGMKDGYPVYAPQTAISDALDVASSILPKHGMNTGTPVYTLAGA